MAIGLVCAALNSLPAQASAQHEDLWIEHVRLDLQLDVDGGTLVGAATLTIRNGGDRPAGEVPILLGRLLAVVSVVSPLGDVPFETDVVRFPDWPEMQVLETWLRLPTPLRPGESFDITIEYGGSIVGYTETGMQYVRDRIAPDFSMIRSDAFSFPTIGAASLASMRRQQRRDFTFEGSVTLSNDSLVVATPGFDRVEQNADGSRTWHFASSDAVPFLLLPIAPYEVHETDRARVYHFQDHGVGARALADAVEAAQQLFAEWFGSPSPSRPVVVMEIPEGWGSQASLVGGIVQTADAFVDGSQLPQLYHELAHLVHPPETERPADRWNEGFASFVQWRVEHASGPGALAERMERLATSILAQDISGWPAPVDYGETDRTGLAYRVGALFFYVLYGALGQPEFDRCLGSYFAAHMLSGSNTAEFDRTIRACGPAAGVVLDEWFQSTRGLERLRSAGSIRALVRAYQTKG